MTPFLTSVLLGAIERVFNSPSSPISKGQEPVLAQKIANEVAKDPVAKNAMNAENPLRSRVVTGSVGAIVLMAGTLLSQWEAGTLDLTAMATLGPAGGLLTAGYALWGRLKSGLKPMWSRLFG